MEGPGLGSEGVSGEGGQEGLGGEYVRREVRESLGGWQRRWGWGCGRLEG